MNDEKRANVALQLARLELESLEVLVGAYEELHDLTNRLLKIEGKGPIDVEPAMVMATTALNQYRTVLVGLETA